METVWQHPAQPSPAPLAVYPAGMRLRVGRGTLPVVVQHRLLTSLRKLLVAALVAALAIQSTLGIAASLPAVLRVAPRQGTTVTSRGVAVRMRAVPSLEPRPAVEEEAAAYEALSAAERQAGAGARLAAAARGHDAAWNNAAESLAQACGVSAEEADAWLAKAFGWSLWIAAGRPSYLEGRAVVPEPEELRRDLAWLKEGPLRLDAGELRHVVGASPAAALRAPEARYARCRASAPERHREAFRELLLRDPKVLELEFDCAGQCAARCFQCWRVSRHG